MSQPDSRICFLGDSFVAGTGDPAVLGWVGRVTARALADGHTLTSYNLGIRRETSRDVLGRWKREVDARAMPGTDTRVVFSFGANDTAVVEGNRRLPLDDTLTHSRRLLREAREHWPLLVVGPPPVADAGHNQRIEQLSRALAELADAEGVPYLEVFSPLMASACWRTEAAAGDGSHPQSGGYSELADLVVAWQQWWFHSGS